MLKKIPVKTAANLTIAILSSVLIFHLFVVFGAIPFAYVWGGKLNSLSEMYFLETISIAINLIFLIAVLLKSKIINWTVSKKIVDFFMWLMTGLFFLNTIGNLFAEKTLEVVFGSVVTGLLFILCLRMANEKDEKPSTPTYRD